MGNNRYKNAKDKRESGGFAPLSYAVLRSHSFKLLSARAVKLLVDLLAQYKGDNNGDLCAAWTIMRDRGWKSKDTLNKALKELRDGDWLEVTRQGGRNKATLYGVTFYNTDDCKGKLDIQSTSIPRSTWRKHEPSPPLTKSKGVLRLPGNGPAFCIMNAHAISGGT
jgi:hypothetical protein